MAGARSKDERERMDTLPFNPTDLAVLLILLLSGLLAMLRGFVAEVLSVAAWVGAFLIAIYQYPLLEPLVTQWTGIDGDIAAFGAGSALFVIAIILLSILAKFVAKPLGQVTLGAVDRTLGVMFGLVRGAVLVSFAYALVVWVLPDETERPNWIRDARTRPYLAAGAAELQRLVPAHMRTEADLQLERARRQAEEELHQRTNDRLTSPSVEAPSKDSAPTDATGYNDRERQELNRAIQGTQ